MNRTLAPQTTAAAEPPLPLALVRPGETVVLESVRCGQGLRHRLAEMGLSVGSRFTVESRMPSGPIILRVKDSRLVLGRGMAAGMFVRAATGTAEEGRR